MIWTPQQDQALLGAARWLRDSAGPQVHRIFGWAGVGKTELAKELANSAPRGGARFLGPTGKSALVMRKRGCEGARTAHQAIYNPRDKSKVRLKMLESDLAAALGEEKTVATLKRVAELQKEIAVERERLAQPAFSFNPESDVQSAGLLVVDEGSMFDARVGQDLLSFGVKTLVLADPFQLPPVFGNGFFTEGREPDIMLTDIRRQALDNPIIAMSKMIREEGKLPEGSYGGSKVIPARAVAQEEVLAADILIVGRNQTRQDYNRRVRQLRGAPDWRPVDGDRIISLRNNYVDGLLNGQLWRVSDSADIDDSECVLTLSDEDDAAHVVSVTASTWYLRGEKDKRPLWIARDLEDLDYGNAITCHKAQGSQFGDVFVFDESYCFKEHRLRWQYTALTRAVEKVTVVRL